MDTRIDEQRTVICIPVFNDWESALLLVDLLDEAAPAYGGPVSIVFVDDASTETPPETVSSTPRVIEHIDILHLRRNVGHQRAIALGLCFVYANVPCRSVVVMDGDGEDAPKDVAALLRRCSENHDRAIVFAKRARRSEGLGFRAGYLAYRIAHYLLTGRKIEFGNFSVVPKHLLSRLVGITEIWNHYAAAVVHARLPVDTVPIRRSPRLVGRSKMNLTTLVIHGMSAISVYGDTVGVRLLALLGSLVFLVGLGILAVIYLRVFTELAIPGWATNAGGLLTVLLTSLLMVSLILVLMILQSRNYSTFVPIRDWQHYVAGCRRIHERRL